MLDTCNIKIRAVLDVGEFMDKTIQRLVLSVTRIVTIHGPEKSTTNDKNCDVTFYNDLVFNTNISLMMGYLFAHNTFWV